MGNENSKSQTTLLQNEEKNPLARIESLINQQRKTIEAKNNLAETKELINAIDYFMSKGRILDAESKHAEEIEQAQRQLRESKQSEQLLSSLRVSTIDSQMQMKQIEKARLQFKEAQEEIQFLNIQLQAHQGDNRIEEEQFNNQLNLIQQERYKQQQQLEKEQQQCQNTAQKLYEKVKKDAEEEINNMNNQLSSFQRQLVEKSKQQQFFKQELVMKQEKLKQIKEKQKQMMLEQQKQMMLEKQKQMMLEKQKQMMLEKQKQMMLEKQKQMMLEQQKQMMLEQQKQMMLEQQKQMQEKQKQMLLEQQKQMLLEQQKLVMLEQQKQKIEMQKQQIEQQRRVKEMIEAAELSKAKTEEDLKKQLEKLNPQQEVNKSQIEFVKQFQAVQEEKPTEEQVKVIEKKHQQVEQVLLQSIKENQEKPQCYVCQEEKNKIIGCRGVLLLHAMLTDQGITSFLTDKPMYQLEQTSRGSYQQKIIQCGIQDSSSYFIANYESPQYMEQKIFEAQSLENYIYNFKNDMAKKIGEKDITPLNIQVFAVQPPNVQFKIFSQSGQKIDIRGKDFKALGINIQTQNLLDKAELSIDMFDPNYNMSWDNFPSYCDQRGALQFHNRIGPTPQIYNFPIGYYGLGLKVLNRYGQDQNWIRADTRPETWIVLYHGTGYSNLKGIMDQNSIKPGIRNAYGGTRCRITGNIIKIGDHQNTYLTDNVQIAEPYSVSLNKKDNMPYSLVFQCRVDPKKVMSPESRPDYYTVENPLDEIRPYRLLIKQIKN